MISKTQKVKSGLYLVSTPIGNLEDITIRALNILRKSDIILCEDTGLIKTFEFFEIKKKLFSYHKFNEKKSTSKLIGELQQGKILSLISDAGTPAVSDPGRILINECIDNKIPIVPIPEASSVTTSASISGFSEKFIFFGFLSEKQSTMIKELRC